MALALALRLVPALSLALALRLTGPGSSPSSIALALALLLARLDMLLWNQVALWRHAAGARTITGYPFGPTNLPVNAFGPWPGGTSLDAASRNCMRVALAREAQRRSLTRPWGWTAPP